MNYPLISEYIEAIKSAEDNFEELSYLRPVLGDDGLPVMTSGNFAVVFKMKDVQSGKFYAVKCFTKEQEGRAEAYREITKELKDDPSPYLTSVRYLDKELFVDTDQTEETEFPVLLMDWVEGKTLDKYLRENLDDKYALEMLAYRFSQLAQWLIPQPFAHGDLKPDNILVREDGALVLVDYDGMYVPSMKGQKARELGSPDFRHPLRTENDFDEHTDDFTLIVILLSLKAISLNPNLYEKYGLKDGLLLSGKDYIDIGKCKLLKELFPSEDIVLNNLISFFIIVLTENSIQETLYGILNSRLSGWQQMRTVSTSYSEKELNGSWRDGFDVVYSKDNTKLLYGPLEESYCYEIKVKECSIREGTKIICDKAFDWAVAGVMQYNTITIPESITHIGDYAFRSQLVETIVIPESVVYIGNNPFASCDNLAKIVCLSNRFVVQNNVLYSSDMKRLIHFGFKGNSFFVPDGVRIIGDSAFEYCKTIEQVHIPSSVISIGQCAFYGCSHLKSVSFHQSVVEIAYDAFYNCESLDHIYIPKGSKKRFEGLLPEFEDKLSENDSPDNSYIDTKVTAEDLSNAWIDEFGAKYSADGKKLLKGADVNSYHIKEGTIIICDNAFIKRDIRFEKIQYITIPNTVKYIGTGVFGLCTSLRNVVIPDSVLSLGSTCFFGCESLESVKMSCKIKRIEEMTFWNCSIKTIELPEDLEEIGESAFRDCVNIDAIKIPESVKMIGEHAFAGCKNLKSANLPSSLRNLGSGAFEGCGLSNVKIPITLSSIKDETFKGCNLTSLFIPNNIKVIGKSSFSYCQQLKDIIISNSVKTIEMSAFCDCTSLESIKIPESVEYIGGLAFAFCESLKNVEILNPQVKMGTYIPFSHCRSIERIKVPNGTSKWFSKWLVDYCDKIVE